ncbi:pyridoxamine 5'-phosphate oxidase [Compostibacter hankyongensis]|uniref:Pyridoxine/pyridoxamine 5'-phosphate oxidase n=1 Tax=Compostibacter hankyongensis TaxID=1007089 RepID=A0ABP8G5G5_9BACT
MKSPVADIRTDYRLTALSEQDALANPVQQFEKWFNEALEVGVAEPNAMTLATSTADGYPSARIVLLKGFDKKGFYFYTNYESRKARQIADNPRGALVFFWRELERQVRIEGILEKTTPEQNEAYYQRRPEGSRISAWASPQSSVIPDRAFLEQATAEVAARFSQSPLRCPAFWGGYCLHPEAIEFWQGRAHRLHDRLRYTRQPSRRWKKERLAP